MNELKPNLEFYGGRWMAFLPLIIFIGIALTLAALQAADVKGMWVAVFVGLIFSFMLAKNKEIFAETIIDGLADKIIIVPVAAWLFVGVFATMLKSAGLVEGIIWAAYNLNIGGALFVVVAFLASALFATSAGTSFGTIIAGMTVLYPAGVFLGADPLLLAAAIGSGGVFGDNIAPISDSTISSAAVMEVDVGGVVRSRIKYAIPASIVSIIIFAIFGSGKGVSGSLPYEELSQYMNPLGLVMLIPALLVIILAMRGAHLIKASLYGTITGLIIALLFGLINFPDILYIKDGMPGGVLLEGIDSLVEIIIFALLLMAMVKVMQEGDGDKLLIEGAEKFVKTPRGAEASTGFLVMVFSGIIGLNAPAILAIGLSYGKPMAEKYNISPYRMANILDALAATLAHSLPWTAGLLLLQNQTVLANEEFGDIIPVLSIGQLSLSYVYVYALILVMVFAIITGWGRTFVNNENITDKES